MERITREDIPWVQDMTKTSRNRISMSLDKFHAVKSAQRYNEEADRNLSFTDYLNIVESGAITLCSK